MSNQTIPKFLQYNLIVSTLGAMLFTTFIKNSNSHANTNSDLFQKALTTLTKKADYLQSYKLFTQLLQAEPSSHEYAYYASLSILHLGNINYYPGERKAYDLALNLCNKALKLSPNNPKYLAILSYIYAKIGLFDRKKKKGLLSGVWSLRKSINLLDEVIGTSSLDSFEPHQYDPIIEKGDVWIQALVGRAEAYRDSPGFFGGDKKAALRILERIHTKNPTHTRAIYVLARTYYKTLQATKAKQLFIKLSNLYKQDKVPKTPINHYIQLQLPYALGRVQWDLKEYKQACKLFNKHIQRFTRSPWGHEWVSRCLEKTGNLSQAKKMMQLALQYEPFNDTYKNRLKKLKKKK